MNANPMNLLSPAHVLSVWQLCHCNAAMTPKLQELMFLAEPGLSFSTLYITIGSSMLNI